MSRPKIRIHDLETNEIIDREMNDQEFATFELEQNANIEHRAEIEAKVQAKSVLLQKLGITEEEAKLLLP